MAEEVVCKHREVISPSGKKSICTLCGQKKEYDLIHPKEPPVVTKRGRINGVLTMILPPGQEPEPVPAATEAEVTVPPVPFEWATMKRREKHAWLEKHRASLVSDLVSLGVKDTSLRWLLPLTILYSLVKKWDIKPAKSKRTGEHYKKRVKAIPSPSGGEDHCRPTQLRRGQATTIPDVQ